MGEPGWHSPWALNVLPNPAVLASFLPLAIILSPPDTTHKVLPPRGLQKGLVGLLNLPSRTIYVNEPGKGLNMFQVWKKHMLWPPRACKWPRLLVLPFGGLSGERESRSCVEGGPGTPTFPASDTPEPPILTMRCWPQGVQPRQAESQAPALEGPTPHPLVTLPGSASFLIPPCRASLGKSLTITGPQEDEGWQLWPPIGACARRSITAGDRPSDPSVM